MKTVTHPSIHSEHGSAITAAAMGAGVLSILVAGFLAYLSNEYILNVRSHRWTQALHLAESGIEIGFAEMNFRYPSTAFQSTNGWSGGSGTYSNTVTLTDTRSAVVGTVKVLVSNVGSINPVITGVGTVTASNYGGPAVSRAVQVRLAASSKFPVGLMSKNSINLNGNNMYSDSYDSTDPTKSTGGRYDSAKRQANGDVASDAVLIDSISVGNADIYGKVSTGPNGTVTIGANGSVGNTFVDANRATDVATGIADGYIRSDFQVDVPDVTLPSGAGSWTSLGSINGNTIINGGDWRVSSISLSGTKTLTIQGNVRLYVTGDTSVAGNAAIVISSNATLTVYSGGNLSIAGNGVQNNTGLATSSQWNGLSTSTSISITGNGDWIGTIYAPEADMTVGGNGSLYGAAVAKSMTLGGNANFHYDESLKNIQGSSGYTVASWQAGQLVGTTFTPE